MDSNALEDEVFARYLLRSLPEEESARIDEMSVTDDDVAWRLRAVEDDLVDAYVRGELTGARRSQFESVYLATADRRNRLARARALATVADGQRTHGAWRKWAIAAALALAVPSFWLLSTRDATTSPQTPAPLSSAETATVAPPPAPVAAPPATPPPITVVSLLLSPPTRAARGVEVLQLPADAGRVILRLQLESNDYPAYRGVLRDLRRNEIAWHSETVSATRDADADVISLTLPPSILDEQNYSLELSGVPASGRAELIASYTFGVKKD